MTQMHQLTAYQHWAYSRIYKREGACFPLRTSFLILPIMYDHMCHMLSNIPHKEYVT